VKSQLGRPAGVTVLVRHPKAGGSYALAPRPPGTEDLPDAYLIPIEVKGGSTEAKLEVVEQTPSRSSMTIWDARAEILLEGILAVNNLDPAMRAKLEPIVKLRQEIGRIDTEIDGKTHTRQELDQRANEARQNLGAIQKDTSAAATGLRKRLTDRLEQLAKDGDKLGRDLVELQTKRTDKKVALEDLLQALELVPKEPIAPKTK
jgi:septal ring factor EnvC (AmiA/AmiB activator)